MARVWFKLAVAAAIEFGAGNVNRDILGNLVDGFGLAQPILDTVSPSSSTTTCTLNVDLILATVFSLAGPTECKLCDAAAGLTKDVTCLVNKSCFKKTEELVTFHCLRPKSTEFFEISPSDPAIQTAFDFSKPFGFVIHGFADNFPGNYPIVGEGWLKKITVDWAASDINTIAVNWGELSLELLNYFVVSQINTVRTAEYVVRLIEVLESKGAKISETSIVGHSLGAQISSKIGSALKKKGQILKAIYGLDPAGPCYTFPCNAPLNQRLDKGDAAFVQCIHSWVLNHASTCGCVDFYLNWGIEQPLHLDPITAHYFAVIIFDWTLTQGNDCKARTSTELLGIRSQGVCGIYHLDTNALRPYCTVNDGLIGGPIAL